MIPNNLRLKVLLVCFYLFILPVSIINFAIAAQKMSMDVAPNDPSKIYAKVTDVINTGSFTYVAVEINNENIWAAGPITTINKGDMVEFSTKMPMKNFYSKSLKRNFSILYFSKKYTVYNETSVVRTFDEVKIGGYLREVTLDGLNGQAQNFSAFKGKPLIINIWASWCGPCRAEMGSLERLSQRYNTKEFNIIGISTDDYRDKAEAFIKATNISFNNFIDHQLLLENMLGAKTIPLTIFVASDGRVLKKIRGAHEWDSEQNITSISEIFHINLLP